MSVKVQIEGLRYAGKSTLVMALVKQLFNEGYSVMAIPEWRFKDNGPIELDDWITAVVKERIHSYKISQNSNADITICDRSFIGIEAFIRDKQLSVDKYLYSVEQEMYIADLHIFLFAKESILENRVKQREGKATLISKSEIVRHYMDIYNRLNIQPVKINTAHYSIDQLSSCVLNHIKNLKMEVGYVCK